MLVIAIVGAVCPPAVSVRAAEGFNANLRSLYYSYIAGSHTEEYNEYNRFTLHDFDGDGIPEVLLGIALSNAPKFVAYDVYKYENGKFGHIGKISTSRYLVKDKFSRAILGMYSTSDDTGVTVELNNFYIHNATVQKNSVLYSSGNTFLKGPLLISKQQYEEELYNYLGSYDELIVHDIFSRSVIMACVYSWQPQPLALLNTQKLKSNITLNTWQSKYFEYLENYPDGPTDTKYEFYEPEYPRAPATYTRYALYDITGNGVPELLIGVNHGTQISFDVYRYVGGEVKFMGSFDSYSKYMSKFPNSRDIFAFDPVSDQFGYQSANRMSYRDNALSKTQLMSVYPNSDASKTVFQVNSAATTEAAYNKALTAYINDTVEIKTYDFEIVPHSAVLAGWRTMPY
jgi:hypothetical protein